MKQSIETLCVKLNEFRIAYNTFATSEFREYCKIEKVPYYNNLITELAKSKVITKVAYGKYQWSSTPLHISKLSLIIEACRTTVNLSSNKELTKAKSINDLTVSEMIKKIESTGLKVKQSNEELTDDMMINALKALGIKVLRPVQTFEEI